jgi:hypothetical protein
MGDGDALHNSGSQEGEPASRYGGATAEGSKPATGMR